jgi:hypothetical protein
MAVRGKKAEKNVAEQQDLIPNRDLPDVEKAAKAYKRVLNERQDLTRREVELQADLLGLMKKHKITVYDHDGIHAEIMIEKERVKVKIAKDEDDEEDS